MDFSCERCGWTAGVSAWSVYPFFYSLSSLLCFCLAPCFSLPANAWLFSGRPVIFIKRPFLFLDDVGGLCTVFELFPYFINGVSLFHMSNDVRRAPPPFFQAASPARMFFAFSAEPFGLPLPPPPSTCTCWLWYRCPCFRSDRICPPALIACSYGQTGLLAFFFAMTSRMIPK